MLYDTNKFTSTYERGVISGANYADYPNTGTTYTERRQGGESAPTPSLSCAFGGALYYPETDKWYLQGGSVSCGDKNFNVANKLVDTSVSGSFLVFLRLDKITANTDDNNELILPGIKTCEGTPEWDSKVYSEGASYPSNTNFTSPTSQGKIIIPLGVMIIEDGEVSFGSGACGGVFVDQCAGTLSFVR